jgi:hypothetical protein
MDAHFISGDFLSVTLPKEKLYLLRYFSTDIQRAFLFYMHVFGEWSMFMDHTGHRCSRRNLQILSVRLVDIQAAHKKAKESFDFDALEKIEKGKYKVTTGELE